MRDYNQVRQKKDWDVRFTMRLNAEDMAIIVQLFKDIYKKRNITMAGTARDFVELSVELFRQTYKDKGMELGFDDKKEAVAYLESSMQYVAGTVKMEDINDQKELLQNTSMYDRISEAVQKPTGAPDLDVLELTRKERERNE